MNGIIEQMYQNIGQAALGLAEGLKGKLLVYAEVEDEVISADIFYRNEAGIVRFLFCSEPMRQLIYSFWNKWKEQPGNREWRTMACVLENGKMDITLTYPDQIDSDEDTSDRRPRIIEQHFSGMKVDYSRPK